MDLVTGALGSVVEKLAELLKEEYNVQKRVREKITTLSRDLESMHAALRKVAEVPPYELGEETKLWGCDVRELSYKAEDILDTFLVRVHGRKRKDNPNTKWYERVGALNKIFEMLNNIKAQHQIAGMIKIINDKANEVAMRHQRYGAEDIVAKPAPKNTVDPRLKLMYKEVAQLVGIEEPSGMLISMLSSSPHDVSNKKLKIVSVVGFGGLGKTTLVKAVYDKLISDYDCGAFVSVGQKPILVDVFKKILFLLNKQEYQNIHQIESIALLVGELQKFLRNKRFLIVIDDIWEIESWQIIDSAFVEDNNGSRIITTTRNVEVAHGVVYKLQPLSDDNSKRLFHTRVFSGEDKCPVDHPAEVSNAILKKCGGVPLAIITMASLLVGRSKEKWIEVCNSPGFHRSKDDRHVDNTMRILALSYYDLPYHLKSCLLYLSVFPEDHIIDKASLIWKWIAEGFVEKKHGIGLFEVGEEYFHDLIKRSMIQEVISRTYDDLYIRASGCRVHDMVLDLIISKSHEENFVSDQGMLSESRARRLAQKNRTLQHLTPHQDDSPVDQPQVRSFLACVCYIDKWTCRHKRFELLRVLALERCRTSFAEEFHGLEHLGNLLHLRYLGIRNTYVIKKLPEEIGKLKFLQILDLEDTEIQELPSSLGKLTQMVCLRACEIKAPIGIIGKLTSLQELQIDRFDNEESMRQFVKDLGNLRELRMLRTSTFRVDDSMVADFLQCLGSLHVLQHLIIEGGGYIGDEKCQDWDGAVLPRGLRHLIFRGYCFSRLPSCINPSCLPSLSNLDIQVHPMDEQAIKILGGLPELRYLRLEPGTTATAILTANNVAPDGCFQKLRSLVLPLSMVHFVANEDSTVSFTIWNGFDEVDLLGRSTRKRKKGDCIAAPDVMPSLQELQFRVGVKNLIQNNGLCCENLGLEYLTSLQKVRVEFSCWGAFADEVEREEAALMHAIASHPNRPTLQIKYMGKDHVKRRPGGADHIATAEEDEVSPSGHVEPTEQEEDENVEATTLEPFQLNYSHERAPSSHAWLSLVSELLTRHAIGLHILVSSCLVAQLVSTATSSAG